MNQYLFIFHIVTQYDDKICMVIAPTKIQAITILIANNIHTDINEYIEYKVQVSSKEKSGLKKLIEIENPNYEG